MTRGISYSPYHYQMLVACVMTLLLLGMPAYSVWQDPIKPKFEIPQLQDGDVLRFVGNQTHADHFKLLEQDGDHVLIGARNIVYNISISTLQEKKRLEWYSSEEDVTMCTLKGKSEEECQNYIRVLAKKSEDTILVCGTNAFRPKCRHYKQSSNEYVKVKEQSGEGLCPYDPSHNSTAIFADGDLYVATVAQFSGADPLIYREPLRTEQFNFKHLNAPNFVSSLHHGEFVYFFFRETAVEFINCGKAIFSRVARVCTKDKGGPYRFQHRWTSFLKSRLNCSIPGDYPFYFNEIQSTSHFVEGIYGGRKEQLVYAVFTTPQNSLSGSAVCAFRLQDILKTFDGDFKGQEDKNSNWLPVPSSKVPDPQPGYCANNSNTLPEMAVNFLQEHTLMDQSVPAFWGHPVFVHPSFSYRLTYIAVDPQIETADGKKYDVLFIGTDNGKVLKALNAGSANPNGKVIPVIIEEIQVFNVRVPITNLLVYHTLYDNKLVVVSYREIHTIPLHSCEQRAQECSECVGLQDPYCAWDKTRRICTSSRSRFWKSDQFVQNVEEGWDSRCPEDEDITTSESVFQQSDKEVVGITADTVICPPCSLRCVCPPNGWLASDENGISITNDSGRTFGSGTTPQRSRHHSASRHDNQLGSLSSSTMEKDDSGNGITGASRGHPYLYTAETLAIAVTTSIVSSLVVGFISGYIFSRRCRNTEVDSPYDDAHYLEQRDARLTCDMNHSDTFLSPSSNNKPINLVLNVPPKNGNGKNANSSADNKPVQKVKKIYL